MMYMYRSSDAIEAGLGNGNNWNCNSSTNREHQQIQQQQPREIEKGWCNNRLQRVRVQEDFERAFVGGGNVLRTVCDLCRIRRTHA